MKNFYKLFYTILFFVAFLTAITAQNCGVISQASITGSTLTIVVQSTSGGSKSVKVTIKCGDTTIFDQVCRQSEATNTSYNFDITGCSSLITVSYTDHSTAECGGTNCSNGAQISVPLPIELSSFTAANDNDNVDLSWTTSSETNNDYFTIERSGNGSTFDAIGEIDGAGNSSEDRHYQFIDESPLPGLNYYRIKQTDYDGQYSYSEIRSVRHDGAGKIAISPRHTDGRLDITTEMTSYDVAVYSSTGQEVSRFVALSGHQSVSIESLKLGIYFVKVVSGAVSETVKIVKY